MGKAQGVFGNFLMVVIVLILIVSGHYLGEIVDFSGLIITFLILVIINVVANHTGSGAGAALLAFGASVWFLIGFIPGLIIANLNKFFG